MKDEDEDLGVHVLELDMDLSSVSLLQLKQPQRKAQDVRPQKYRRKDRLLFLGKPPSIPEVEHEWQLDRFLILSNLHWVLSESEIREAAVQYGKVRGAHIFEDPLRRKSEGVALLEFTSKDAVQNALKGGGRSWSSKQSDRPVNMHLANSSVIDALKELPGNQPHWTFTSYITPALVNAVFSIAGRTPMTAAAAPPPPPLFQPRTPPPSNELNLPSAISALISRFNLAKGP